MKKLALISVSDKKDIVKFAAELNSLGYDIIATGNTARLLTENKIHVIEISEFASFPEIFDGRVKTLQPKVFGGILMRRDNPSDLKEAEENNVVPIDIVCVNLYPFPKIYERVDIDLDTKIENIDIGGPSLIRAAAKNYKYVSVLTSHLQYDDFIAELKKGGISQETKKKLAAAAFSYTSFYDTLIANYLDQVFEQPVSNIRINLPLEQSLRYGENPHQNAKIFGKFCEYFEILHGKEISYNNVIDLLGSVELVSELESNSCAIVKHTNPCGAASSGNVYDSYLDALSGDPVSAYGGIVAFNCEVDEKTATKLNDIFLEIICAPGFSDKAMELLITKKNRRIVKLLKPIPEKYFVIKNIPGGLIVQDNDNSRISGNDMKDVTIKKVSEDQKDDLIFAWKICKHTKSNAIVFVKNKKLLGNGAGQMSRVDSVKIAVMKAREHGHDLNNSVAASDAYFPFPDGLIEIAKAGAVAVVQPGGSVRDEEVIKAANEKGMAMTFTGIRNFKH